MTGFPCVPAFALKVSAPAAWAGQTATAPTIQLSQTDKDADATEIRRCWTSLPLPAAMLWQSHRSDIIFKP